MSTASSYYASGKQAAVVANLSSLSSLRSAGLVIRRVASSHERHTTDQLVRRMYAWRGYHSEPLKASLNSPDRVTLAAWQDNELAATITLSRDNGAELLCETLYEDEIARLRAKKRQICEYSRLATDPEFSSPVLLNKFFREAYFFARSHFGASDAVVEVNPRHCRYYERAWGFRRLGPLRICPRVDAPAILLHRNLQHPLPEYSANDVKAA